MFARALLAAGALVLACTSPSLAATIKIATVSPDGSVWMKLLRVASREIEAKTDGRVRLKLYPGGVMGDDRAMMRKMRVGQLQGAVVTTGVFNRIFPDLHLYNLPMQFRSLAEVDHVRPQFDAELMQGLEDAGFICVGFAEVGMAYAMATREALSLADARGLKVWTPHGDELAARALSDFGITPVPLTISDVLAGLQTGLIDTVAAPLVGAVALQWHGQLKYVLDLPFMYIFAPMVLVKRPFERLDPRTRRWCGRCWGRQSGMRTRATGGIMTRCGKCCRTRALTFLRPSPAEVQEWQSRADEVTRQWVADGVVTSARYERFTALLGEFRARPN